MLQEHIVAVTCRPSRHLHTLPTKTLCWTQVVHCLALAADMSGDSAAAIRWLEVLTSLVPHDPGVLCKLGAIYHRCAVFEYRRIPLDALECVHMQCVLALQGSALE